MGSRPGISINSCGRLTITAQQSLRTCSPSGYTARLTSESISVINVWMAFVQSLYDAVSVCALDINVDGDVASSTTDIDDLGYVSLVDVTAAFWYGSRQTWFDDGNNGTMYARARIAKIEL
jgi:hypothetical protein